MSSLPRSHSDSTPSDLVQLVSDNVSSASEDAIITVLQQRFRSDLPYTRISSTGLVVLNPLRNLESSNEASAEEYRLKTYVDITWKDEGRPSPHSVLPPHPYELAGRVYHMMRRTAESQAVVFDGASGSGKTSTSQLFTAQLLRLSSSSTKREHKIAEQIRSLDTLLNSFGSAQTESNSNASRFNRYLELHYTAQGRLGAAKVLASGLDKGKLNPLSSGERSFHVFYQLLAGATSEERELFKLDDVTSYSLLATSACYRLASGPSADDSIGMGALRAAMKSLGFKQKHAEAVFSFLSAILLLGNLEFVDQGGIGHHDKSGAVQIANAHILEDISELLGIASEELSQALTHRSRFVRQELVTTLLDSSGAKAQRDSLMRDLYATLFAFVVETANHKLDTDSGVIYPVHIVQLDIPGHQPTANASNSFATFSINSTAECLRNWIYRQELEDSVGVNAVMVRDGISLPDAEQNGDNSSCVEMLRGGLVGSETTDRKPAGLYGALRDAVQDVRTGKIREAEDSSLVKRLDSAAPFAISYISSTKAQLLPGGAFPAFGIKHYQGQVTYSASGFLSREMDAFDATFLHLLRQSHVSFVARLFVGPSLATESHPGDPNSIVSAQVSIRPLRQPSLRHGAEEEDRLLDPRRPYGVSRQMNATLSEILRTISNAGQLWTVYCIRPNDISQPGSLDVRCVKSQVNALALSALVVRNKIRYVRGFTHSDFCTRYPNLIEPAAAAVGGLTEPREKIQAFVIANGWRDTTDYAVGNTKIWLTHDVWRTMEDMLRRAEPEDPLPVARSTMLMANNDPPRRSSLSGLYPPALEHSQSYLTPMSLDGSQSMLTCTSEDDLLLRQQSAATPPQNPFSTSAYGASDAALSTGRNVSAVYGNKWDDKGIYGDANALFAEKAGDASPRAIDAIEEVPMTVIRRWWVRFTWLCTWYIPSFLLSKVGGMKRPDVQMAWREKVTICSMIFFLCGLILFYILVFGRLLCPNADKAWDTDELSTHAGTDGYYVSVAGSVYDLSKFYKRQHSDTSTQVTEDVMLELGGQDLTPYFPVPLPLACPGLVTSETFSLSLNANLTAAYTQAIHTSGPQQPVTTSALADPAWYTSELQPFLKKYYKGTFVYSNKHLADESNWRTWAVVNSNVYDLTNYFETINTATSGTVNNQNVNFLSSELVNLFDQSAGGDITEDFNTVISDMNTTYRQQNLNCLNNAFYVGKTDFRKTPKCLVQNYLLLAFSIILVVTILSKFVAALQLTTKRNPEQQNKFVICQITCYTEGEEELRKTIDSVAGQKYDDKRKLIFIVCDGMIVGSGNELPTPRIVLDILGVESKIDPEPLMFKSVAEGSKQLNYGKVYSGLYEFNGHVVPYIVVVKCGRPSERLRPGNRGKRDTQILMMRYLNRVHFDAPMCPLELEINHQMKNVIGIDPTFYEYVLMVDADTRVEPDGLNRLVAVAADDSRIIAICGETTLDNEEGSWWTMIQVYEYYISHHLSKAFESLFGSVTCLPGCFSMYRIRSADKGRPMLISNRIIDEFSENRVDTLHKKNLFALGEDRYLTTLILKHFPTFRTKFTPDAKAHTSAPDRFSVLLSQRRRWINSTVHNLAELVLMPELCGFCLFSMRFIVFIDLLGTVILPATVVYLIYLIITVSTGVGAFPLISLVMIGAVYGLQMVIFLLKRQWQYIGWMIIYLLAFPIYSFFLPVYSFWHMDDFSWGNTRIVVGEKGKKKIIAGTDDEPYDDSMIPLKRFSEYQRDVWEQRTGVGSVKDNESLDYSPHHRQAFYEAGSNGSVMLQGNQSNAVRSGRGTPGYKSPFESPLHGMSRPGSMLKKPSYAGSLAGGSEVGGTLDYFQSTNLLERQPHSRNSSYTLNDGFRSGSRGRSTPFGGPLAPSGPGGELPRVPSQMSMGPGGLPLVPGVNSMYGLPSVGLSGSSTYSMYGMPPMGIQPQGGASYSSLNYSYDALNRPGSSVALGAQYTGGGAGSSLNPRMSMMSSSNLGASTVGVGVGGGVLNPFSSTSNLRDPLPPASSLARNENEDPSEEELKSAIICFLGCQTDLYSVTKRSVRTAVEGSFFKADLSGKKSLLNRLIDEVLEGKT